ncbi:glycerol-3-phosphate acyltransferase [Paenibacillus agricola]|uniref:Glycerol-3-phosphate acyltransferase n=1 Tax=Paenibacillus agricola TaxID=2716264 RepID=A0ABX0JDB8_9BACL|nr:glycerol-3-phosphate acyltransferase [Paenibacillus agricola]NHN33385.1 glycerol-3-phosphate acyltransferase [Paenibacillus agricola]
MIVPIIFLFVAYGLGCLSVAYLWVKLKYGQDIRTLGSGTAGARNAGRMYGSSTFMITLLGDAAKAALAIYLATRITESLAYMAVIGLIVIVGHIYPVFLGFQGGKGMAPFAGGALMIDWRIFLIMLLIAGLLLLVFRRFTPAGLTALLTYPFLIYLFYEAWSFALIGLFTILVVIHAHRSNIKELIRSWSR